MTETILEIKHLKKSYGENQVLKDISLTVRKGEVISIIGSSGSGKSTFLHSINLLETPSCGEVIVDGQIVNKLNRTDLRLYRQKIGMIFQQFNLLSSKTVAENIAFNLKAGDVDSKEIPKRIDELLELVGLTDKKNVYPNQLSGGQKQRVGIAKALANNPKVLLCDEATSALDPKTTKDILNLLVEINKRLGLTIVLITHEMHVVRQICHRVAVMEQGRVVETGEVLDVFKNPQQTITKQFVGEERSEQDLHDVFEHLSTSLRPGVAVRIQYLGDTTAEGILSEVIRKLDVSISILQAHVNVTQKGVLGSMIILIEEESAKAEEVIDFLRKAEIIVEVLENV